MIIMIEVFKNCAITTLVIREAFLSVSELCFSNSVKNLVDEVITKLTSEIVIETKIAIILEPVETSAASSADYLSLSDF